MNKKKGLFLTIIFAGLLLFSSCGGFRINQEFSRLQINFENKDSILKLEQDPALFLLWTKWRPIELLMTGEEKKLAKTILKIQDDVERNAKIGAFIKWFWARRDDGSGVSEEGGFNKEIFYNRVVEAQTRFAREEDVQYKRRCKYGKGWETDMGIIYIILGEPFDRYREQIQALASFLGVSYADIFAPEEIEVWYYNTPENYNGMLFQEGAAWILFEKDLSGWQFGEKTFNLFFNYENYGLYRLNNLTMNYGTYIGEVYGLVNAIAESRIYNEDLEFEDIK